MTRPAANYPPEGAPLNERELQVLRLAALGRTSGQTGIEMHLSLDTVKTYRRRLFRKLGVDTIAHAVAVGIARGLITLPTGSTPVVAGPLIARMPA